MLRRILLSAMLFSLVLSTACYAQSSVVLTLEDCARLFPETNSCEKIGGLDTDIVYGEAWCNDGTKETPDTFLGYVFLKTLTHEGKTLDLFVGTTESGVIKEVRVKGAGEIAEEFLAQFQGKTAQHNFDLACNPEDILYVPIKIKALQGNISLSATIAQGVKAIATVAPRVVKN